MARLTVLVILSFTVLTLAFVFYQKTKPPLEAEARQEWRRTAIENETASRPTEYVDMKANDTEIRVPASKK